jgi:hypothetical protein
MRSGGTPDYPRQLHCILRELYGTLILGAEMIITAGMSLVLFDQLRPGETSM